MPSTFAVKKRVILAQLAVPDGEYIDASPKGSIDAGIRELVDEINQEEGMVTTSSCAGRVAVYVEGRKGAASRGDDSHADVSERTASSEVGGKGGGHWLFVSHDHLPLNEDDNEDLVPSLGFRFASCEPHALSALQDSSLVHCKFEPMILHILASSMDLGRQILAAALTSGFRESGISSVTGSSDNPDTVMVAVRTNGLAFDSIIGFESADGDIIPMVPETYLRTLVQIANQRFRTNKERTERFRSALLYRDTRKPSGRSGDWEPAEARRARKREEGLRRRAEKLSNMASEQDSAADASAHAWEHEGIDFLGGSSS